MKLVIAVVEDSDSRPLMDALNRAGLSFTRLASTGGFLLEGNTTLMLGVDDGRVDEALQLVRTTCVRRQRLLPQPVTEIPGSTPMPLEVEVGGAIIWVLDVEHVERI